MFIKWKDQYINTINITYLKEINKETLIIYFINKTLINIKDSEENIKKILDLIKRINYLPEYTEI